MKTYSSEPSQSEKRLNIDCPICGSSSFKKKWSVKSSHFVTCRSCGMVYQNPQPQWEGLIDRYDNDYFQYEIENQNAFLGLALLGLKDVGFPPVPIEKGALFLDAGCATGALLAYMEEQGWKGQGIEICRQSVQYARKERGLQVHLGPLEDWDGSPESLQVFHSSHVIEHLMDPIGFVQRAYNLLKPGGDFICTTPNLSGLQARWFKGKWRSAIEDHLCLFTLTNLKRILKQHGFKVIRQKTWGGLAEGAGLPGLKRILDPMVKVFGCGDVMILWAKKPN